MSASVFSDDRHGNGRQTAVEYGYDEPVQLENMTEVIEYGEVDLENSGDIGGDLCRIDLSLMMSRTAP